MVVAVIGIMSDNAKQTSVHFL